MSGTLFFQNSAWWTSSEHRNGQLFLVETKFVPTNLVSPLIKQLRSAINMGYALKIPITSKILDRPGWIPSHIVDYWDPDPYAYQTEEELMGDGGPHGQLSGYLMELLRSPLKKRGLMLLQNSFLLYRDHQGIKQRIAPDLLLMPFGFPAPSSYDLDLEPPPLCVVELTSPHSHKNDLKDKVSLYLGLDIPTYLIIDAIRPDDQLRQQIELHVWRREAGQACEMSPDVDGRLGLPEMGLHIQAQGRELLFIDDHTKEVLLDMDKLQAALEAEKQKAILEKRRLVWETRRAEIEAERAKVAAKEAAKEAKRADREAKRADKEAEARRAAEAEIARLKALLANKV
jgi:Uma2 family endonuclease